MKTNVLVLILLGLTATIHTQAADPVLTTTIVAGDQMRFSVTHLVVHRGQSVHVILRNDGTMPKEVMGHNWVLLRSGVDPVAYATAAMSAAKENYQPAAHAADVLAAIPMLGPKKSGEVTFTAPNQPGKYAFLCSFPAHCQAGMRGELVVE